MIYCTLKSEHVMGNNQIETYKMGKLKIWDKSYKSERLGLPNVHTTHATEGHEPVFLGSTQAKVWLVRRWVLPFENTKGTF